MIAQNTENVCDCSNIKNILKNNKIPASQQSMATVRPNEERGTARRKYLIDNRLKIFGVGPVHGHGAGGGRAALPRAQAGAVLLLALLRPDVPGGVPGAGQRHRGPQGL